MHFNVFSISWQNKSFYTFPPFAVIGKIIHKIVLDVATGMIVVPNCPTQPWYSLLMKLLIDIPILLNSSKTFFRHLAKSKTHPLANMLTLLACIIWQLYWEMKSVLSWKGYWSHFNIFKLTNWIPNQNPWIGCWVIISRHSKISPVICAHHGQWYILWETSPCSTIYERYV